MPIFINLCNTAVRGGSPKNEDRQMDLTQGAIGPNYSSDDLDQAQHKSK